MKADNVGKLVDHLFRHEAGKMVSVLTRTFGTENLELAEDVVQDALLQATQVWPIRGIPDNPSAWLYRAAKNKAIDVLRRDSRSVRISTDGEDLMEEAMLLCRMLSENPLTQIPDTFALMALMCFHASRNTTRVSPAGDIVLLQYQDRSKWNFHLISLGNEYMAKSASGDSVSRYHIEAAIAFEHCTAKTYETTNWKRILELYKWLCRDFPSPVSALNRAVAVMRVHGPAEALSAIDTIPDKKRLKGYYLYHSLRGEIYSRLGMTDEADAEFETALRLTNSDSEKRLLRGKITGKEHHSR